MWAQENGCCWGRRTFDCNVREVMILRARTELNVYGHNKKMIKCESDEVKTHPPPPKKIKQNVEIAFKF